MNSNTRSNVCLTGVAMATILAGVSVTAACDESEGIRILRNSAGPCISWSSPGEGKQYKVWFHAGDSPHGEFRVAVPEGENTYERWFDGTAGRGGFRFHTTPQVFEDLEFEFHPHQGKTGQWMQHGEGGVWLQHLEDGLEKLHEHGNMHEMLGDENVQVWVQRLHDGLSQLHEGGAWHEMLGDDENVQVWVERLHDGLSQLHEGGAWHEMLGDDENVQVWVQRLHDGLSQLHEGGAWHEMLGDEENVKVWVEQLRDGVSKLHEHGQQDDEITHFTFAKPDDDPFVRRGVVALPQDVGSKSIEVRTENGKVTVKVNGKEIPADRVKSEDGRIIILDEGGDPIDELDMHFRVMGDGPGEMGEFHFLDMEDLPDGFFGREVDAAPTPNVMMGVHVGEPGSALDHHLHLEPGSTTMITATFSGLPADEAGIKPYAIITKIDGHAPAGPAMLREMLSDKQPGDVIRLTIIQHGERRSAEVHLAPWDQEAMADAELFGDAPDDTQLGGMKFGGDAPMWLDRLEAPGAIGRIFMDGENRFFEVPDMEFDSFEETAPEDPEGGLDNRLDNLNERLSELEKLLESLLERARRDG